MCCTARAGITRRCLSAPAGIRGSLVCKSPDRRVNGAVPPDNLPPEGNVTPAERVAFALKSFMRCRFTDWDSDAKHVCR